MKKKLSASMGAVIISGVFLFLLLIFIGSASGKTITVDDDGDADFSKIQNAVDHTKDGDTVFVKSGIYKERIEINNSITIIGEDIQSTTIRGYSHASDLVKIVSDNAHIEGFTFETGNRGIIVQAYHVIIRNNIFINFSSGINFYLSQSGLSEGNSFYFCDYGIRLSASHNNSILNCDFIQSDMGVYCNLGWNNNNNISQCKFSSYDTNCIIIEGNRNEVNNCIFIDTEPGRWGIGVVVFGDGNTIQNSSFAGNDRSGIYLQQSRNTTIRFCILQNNTIGIEILADNEHIQVDHCNIFSNINAGLNISNDVPDNISISKNWWGNNTGPFHTEKNPLGSGDNISGDIVDFSPWLTEYLNILPKIFVNPLECDRKLSGVINITGKAWDIDGDIEKVEYSIDGNHWNPVQGTTSWYLEWNTSDSPEGEYSLQFRSYDGKDHSKIDDVRFNVEEHEDEIHFFTYLILIILLIVVSSILIFVIFDLAGKSRNCGNH